MPLWWSHAEYVALVRSHHDGFPSIESSAYSINVDKLNTA